MLFRLFTILAVAALAVSTWILTSPAERPAQGDDRHDQLPGYFLKNAVMTDYDEKGLPGVRVEAERMDQVANSTEVTMRNVKVNYQPENGESWIMFGDTAQVERGTKLIHVQGNVKLQGDPAALGRTFAPPVIHTDALTYDVNDSTVTVPGDARLDFGRHYLNSHGVWANLKDQTMRLESKVNGRFYP